VTEKVAALVDPVADLAPSVPATLGRATPAELLALLCDPVVAPVGG
jgi:hypothetical protein